MAVRAQYPSNVLLLNRNVQEGNNLLENNYSFLDQSQMMFSNGVGSNPRKRGRESPNTVINHPFSIQLNPPQFMDLTQLQTPQPNAVSTGLRLAFGEQQRQQQSQPPQQRKHQQLQQQQLQNLSPQSSVLWSLLSEDLATQIRQQREEIEQFLQAQGEQLRRTLADNRQIHYRALLNAAEETAARKLREKEAEVDKAARRNAELEARAAQLTAQAHAWQARARAQEAAAAALREQLQQAIVTGGRRQDEWGEEAEDAESVCGDPEQVAAAIGPSCKACRRRVASVVLLPCRHLCLCTGCGALAQSCPLCLAVRESSVEILLS
ncbi:hypothetical protein RHGRI_020308 [Rhododendron griersonianum]|uniref:RING-type domain-containing protein n=1 Tax=Rhododendron griersonianum TaxID=479676 RepID=A0AAV6JJ68_9ERIC|nr:hypothetical protein RHGRI_020308 [Rhododendron griersonianum]